MWSTRYNLNDTQSSHIKSDFSAGSDNAFQRMAAAGVTTANTLAGTKPTANMASTVPGVTTSATPGHHPPASEFTTHIDNPYFTLTPGTVLTYVDKGTHEVDVVTVTDQTRVVDGVTCVQVHDVSYMDGSLTEDTLDWYAQDSEGNVWYFGELTQQFEPGNPNPIGFEGSFEAGVNGAKAGYIMEANPQVGDSYYEERAPGVAVDQTAVADLDKHVSIADGSYNHLLKTNNTSPLEPGYVESKFYSTDVGLTVLEIDNEGGYLELKQITKNGGASADTLNGHLGHDTLNGNAGDDLLNGLNGSDHLYGGDGADHELGGSGGDWLDGGAGADTLDGGKGADTVAGGIGNDIMSGGGGADTFVFSESDGSATDTISDYSAAQGDTLEVVNGETGVAFDSFVNGAWQLTLNDGHVIVLTGVADANHDGHIVDNVLFA